MSALLKPLLDAPLPESHWAASAVAGPETGPLDGSVRVDVAVVGAGVAGLSTAIHLAEQGVRVAVLEAREPGFGGSGRNNGQIIPTLSRLDPANLTAAYGEAKGSALARMVGGSAALVFELIERYQMRCDGSGSHVSQAIVPVQTLSNPIRTLPRPRFDRL